MNKVVARTIGHVAASPETDELMENGFIENIEAIRKRARQHIEQGAVTAAYKTDRNAVVSLLNDALAGAERQE